MKNLTHVNPTTKTTSYQLVLPLNVEILIPENDSVRLLSEIMDQLDYSALYKAYSRKGRKSAVSPRNLFKIMVYGYINNIYASRALEQACHSYLEDRKQTYYIKPSNYEKVKSKKHRNNVHLLGNVTYDEKKDEYTCRNGKKIQAVGVTTRKSKSGYKSTVTIYECEDCSDCSYKPLCTKNGRKPPVPCIKEISATTGSILSEHYKP